MDLSAEKSGDKGFGETSGQRVQEKTDNSIIRLDRSIDELSACPTTYIMSERGESLKILARALSILLRYPRTSKRVVRAVERSLVLLSSLFPLFLSISLN
jgi:hypothetical protein